MALLILGAFDLGDTTWSTLNSAGTPFAGYWLTAALWSGGSFAALKTDNRTFHAVFALVFAIAATTLTVLDPSLEGIRTLR